MQGIATLPYEVQNTPLVPTGGVETMRRAAEMLADFGREGDTYIVHAAEGETVIPLEVLEANPRMKKMLFKQMEDMGLEPERYVVGSEFNSINPVTGQPEFFLKKLFKSVKKLVKKIAPIVLPIAAPFLFPAMPAFLASGLGSFVGAKIGGASTKDAFKQALISGVLSGGTRMLTGGSFTGSVAAPQGGIGTFGVQDALTPVNPFSEAGQQQLAQLQAQGAQATQEALQQSATNPSLFEEYVYNPAENTSKFVIDPKTGVASVETSGESFLEKYLSPSRTSIDATTQANQAAANAVNKAKELAATFNQPVPTEAELMKIAQNAASAVSAEAPGVLAKYGPLAGVGIGAALTMDKPVDEDGDGYDDRTGAKIIAEDKASGTYKYAFDPNLFYGNNPYYGAGGGEISGPGTGTSDSIPAMLSDGEFVMTANAVRGAGGGDRQQGAKRMYAMMRQFEGKA